jgi:hypothetical protein
MKFLIFLILILKLVLNQIEPHELHQNVLLSYSSFCSETSLKNWDCFYCNHTRVENLRYFNNNTTDTHGYIGVFKDKSILFIK